MGAKITRHSLTDHDTPDDVSGLTCRDIHNVQHTWAHIFSNAEGKGQELIKRLFHADPDTKSLHKGFRHMDDENLSKCPQFRATVLILMNGIDLVISNLNQTDVAIALLHSIGEPLRHVHKKHFDNMEKVAIQYLTTEQKASESVLNSWNKVFAFMYQHIKGLASRS